MRVRGLTVVACASLFVIATSFAEAAGAQAQAAGRDCVTIGTPKPSVGYTYRLTQSSGSVSEFTHQWEEVTQTGSRVRTTRGGSRGAAVSTSINRHRIVDDVSVIDAATSTGTDANGPFNNTTTYKPGVVSDPAFRACTGRSWTIAAVTATHQSRQGTFSAQSDPGVLKIVAIHEPITVPAGRFDTVHYTRTTTSARGSTVDEYWKSIEHGVIVRHTSTLPGATVTELLQSIK